MNISEQLSALIRDPDLEKLKLSLKVTNFFSILKLESVEIRHSNFLSWLLDPNGSHNLGDIFLRWFLKDIFADEKITWTNEFFAEIFDYNKVRVLREWKNIDILIESEDFVICIENKVFAKESNHQLSEYIRKIKTHYPDKQHAFVFLTPNGQIPKKLEDQNEYVIYSYQEIIRNLEIILKIYSGSLSDKVRFYLEDYLTIIRRDIMKDHESIELAKAIYQKHKEALDFIYENRPDRLAEISPIIEQAITNRGYILQTLNKGFVRFLTPKLNSIIPKTGTEGWKGKEAFAFEIDFWPKNVNFKTVIAPGDQHIREVIRNAIAKVEGTKEPTGNKWWVQYSYMEKKDLTEEKYEDNNLIKETIEHILDKNKHIIEHVEEEILKVASKFSQTREH